MTPEQRAKIQAAMQARGGGSKATVSKNCLTKDKLDKPFNLGDENTKSCARSLVTSSGSKQEIRIDCDREGMKSTGTVKVEAVDSENVKGSMQMSVTNGATHHEYELHVRGQMDRAGLQPRNKGRRGFSRVPPLKIPTRLKPRVPCQCGKIVFQIGRQGRGHRDSLPCSGASERDLPRMQEIASQSARGRAV